MITKISIDRSFIFTPSTHILVRAKISGRPSLDTIKKAILHIIPKYDILNCKIFQDGNGECYYVKKDTPSYPHLEVRSSLLPSQQFINEQERIPFNLENGILQRYIIEDNGQEFILNIVQHQLAGDGSSLLQLLDVIMETVQALENKEDLKLLEKPSIPVKVIDENYLKQEVTLNPLSMEAVRNWNQKWSKEENFFTLADANSLFQNYWAERKTTVETASISGNVLKSILDACSRHGIVLTNLILTIISASLANKTQIQIASDLRNNEFSGLGSYTGYVEMKSLYNDNLDIWQNAYITQQLVINQLMDKKQLLADMLFKCSISNGLRDSVHFQSNNMFQHPVVDAFSSSTSSDLNHIPFRIHSLQDSMIKETYGKNSIQELSFFSSLPPELDCNLNVVMTTKNLIINMSYLKNSTNFSFIFADLVATLVALGEHE